MPMSPQSTDEPAPKHGSVVKRMFIEHYDQLHVIAAKQMAKENAGNTLETTALINEAALRMLNAEKPIAVNDAKHFLASAKMIMKHILTDRARHKRSEKAGGKFQRRDLTDTVAGDHKEI